MLRESTDSQDEDPPMSQSDSWKCKNDESGGKRENTFRNSELHVCSVITSYISLCSFEQLPVLVSAEIGLNHNTSPLGTPQGRTFMKYLLHTALHPHSKGSNS